jgi:FkbH-like protein
MYVFDYDRLVQEFGITRWHDARLGYWGRVPFGAEAQIACGRRMARYVRALYFPPCKCLALDLDNTLWGGVLGEDSPSGIRLGEDYPGNVFKAFQRRLRALRDQGVLLAVASKNNPQEALDALACHPDMLLRPDDFAAMEIHWGDKAASLRAIADRLNIGIDSIAFFDDDPVEREWVRSCLPQVTVIDAPKDPADYIRALDDSEAFDRLTLSDEDLRRGAMLAETEKRREWREQSATLEDFLRGLRMVVTVGRVGPDTLERVAQLIQKTNQFNLTARRRTAAEIDEMIGSGAVALWARVRDRFGDSGLTGVALALPRGDGSWLIDTFLLSCRVLGRRVEAALLAALAGCVARRGGALLTGEHIPTGRNDVASDFFSAHGFWPAPGEPGRWSFDLRAGLVAAPDFIEIEKEGPDL